MTVRYTHGWGTLYMDRLDKIMADFTAKNPTIKAEHQRQPDNSKLQEDLARELAAGAPPDVSMQWRGAMPGLAGRASFTELDPYIKRDKFDASIYYENEYKSSQFLGKTYVLPMAATGAWYMVFYNRDHFREAGLDENRAAGHMGRGGTLRRGLEQAGGRWEDRSGSDLSPGLRTEFFQLSAGGVDSLKWGQVCFRRWA